MNKISNINEICSGISTEWLVIHCFHISNCNFLFRNVGFCGGKKTREQENPPSKDENQQQTHSPTGLPSFFVNVAKML